MKSSSLVGVRVLRGVACSLLATGVALVDPGRADACGGCFVQQTERTVVTDHRMALSVSQTQTVLWDQIRYSGDPAEFAWVLPVRAGAKLELSNDAFFTALDASTQPTVIAPQTYGGNYGCGLTGCSSVTSAFSADAVPGPGQVQILSQAVVGPYETVTLRATDPAALRKWLKSHAYDIPAAVEPVIDAYVAESFDFIALRLRPDCGERSMQPVRIVTQGADPTLPLRMVAAGVGARVGITLYVISEGRYQPQNFPHALIDDAKVTWSRTQNKSNYESLVDSLMAGQNGRTWVSEYADKPQLFTAYDPRFGGARAPGYVPTGSGAVPALADTYYSQCGSRYGSATGTSTGTGTSGSPNTPAGQSPFTTPCRNGADAGIGEQDASVDASRNGDAGDAGDAAAIDPDAGADAGGSDGGDGDGGDLADGGDADGGTADGGATSDGGSEPTNPNAGDVPSPSSNAECLYLDDIDVALRGLNATDVWVTRLRANLPANALSAGDLKLEAAAEQTPLSNVHYAAGYDDEASAGSGSRDACVSAPKRHTAFGSWALAAVSAIAAVAFLRRRTRR
ncbi:MAG: hypothetical protein JWO86_8962 [Myxococcaceae bacterium]|nr:hypothetical protein [Myxococcaceae bacterium]